MKLRIIEKKFKDGSVVYVIQQKNAWLLPWEDYCYEVEPDGNPDPFLIPIYFESYQKAVAKLEVIKNKYISDKNAGTIEKINILHETKIDL